MSKTIPAEVPVRLIDVIDREELVVTRGGEPIARLIPLRSPRHHLTLEELRQSGRIVGDIMGPVDDWDVER